MKMDKIAIKLIHIVFFIKGKVHELGQKLDNFHYSRHQFEFNYHYSLLMIIKNHKKIIMCPKFKREGGGLVVGQMAQIHMSQNA